MIGSTAGWSISTDSSDWDSGDGKGLISGNMTLPLAMAIKAKSTRARILFSSYVLGKTGNKHHYYYSPVSPWPYVYISTYQIGLDDLLNDKLSFIRNLVSLMIGFIAIIGLLPAVYLFIWIAIRRLFE
jgi:hypothetical protein